jgi:hypothetical protein
MKCLSINVAVVFFMLSFVVVSCYYDNEEALYPDLNTSCDTSNVNFGITITTLLDNSCYSCHSNTNAASRGNNIRLENYADVVSRVLSVAGSIKHTGSFSPMPKNGGRIKACSITQFDIWVRTGMPQ